MMRIERTAGLFTISNPPACPRPLKRSRLTPNLTYDPLYISNNTFVLSRRFNTESDSTKVPKLLKRRKPNGYWKEIENKRDFLSFLATKLSFPPNDLSAFYKLTNKDLISHGGSGLLFSSKNSISAVLRAAYPNHEWDLTRFGNKPHRFWREKSNQRGFLVDLARKLGFKKTDLERWYDIDSEILLKNGAGGLINEYNGSIGALLSSAFPGLPWDLSRFSSRSHWADLSNQRLFLTNLALKLGAKQGDMDFWYRLSPLAIRKNGGGGLLELYSSSITSLLTTVFPEHKWDMDRFQTRPHSYWQSYETQKGFMVRLGKALGIKEGDFEGWYKVTNATVARHGGAGLLKSFNGSLFDAMVRIFPEYSWKPWDFEKAPKGSIETSQKFEEVVALLEDRLQIKEPRDWQRRSAKEVAELGFKSFLGKYGGLSGVLKKAYPGIDWRKRKAEL